MPRSANHALVRVQNAVAVSYALIGEQFGVDESAMPVDRGKQEVMTAQGMAAFTFLPELLLAWELRLPTVRPSIRQPPPAGILPSFLTSTCTRSPHRVDSMRRITRPVGRSRGDGMMLGPLRI
jgi:hypothetical protein